MFSEELFQSCKQRSMVNILLNATAAMLVYGAHFGMAIISPAMLEALDGIRGINKHLVYTGMCVSCIVTVISCSLIPPMINKLGTKFCLIAGSILIATLHPAMIYPIPVIFCIAEGLNGFGCALLRASSLKYLTDNSNEKDLARNNSIHWSIFMASLIVGNTVVMIVTGSNGTIDDNLRIQITCSLIALNSLGIILYFFARPPLKILDEEEAPILTTRLSQSSHSDSGIEDGNVSEGSTPHDELAEAEYTPQALHPRFEKESGDVNIPYTPPDSPEPFKKPTSTLKSKIVINLLFTMIACGVLAGVYGTTFPDYIGRAFSAKIIVPAFGILVGLGEILGSVITGRLISVIGMKKSICCVAALGIFMFILTAIIFPLTDFSDPLLTPHYSVALLIGLGLGMSDVGFGVILSTLIGRIFKGNSQTAFSLYSGVFNMAVVGSCILSSYSNLLVMVFVFSGVLVCAVIGIISIEYRGFTEKTEG